MPYILDPGKKIPKKIVKKLKKLKNHFPTFFFSQTGMRQVEKERKKFYFRIQFKPDSGKKIPKRIAKKLKKLKKTSSDINFSQNGRRQAEIEKKKFYSRIPFILDPGKRIPKKIAKNLKSSFRHYFQPKRDEIGREREKKNLLPNSVHTRLGQENSEKNSK